jgi:DNA polymerase-4
VVGNRAAKSSGTENTFAHDLTSLETIRSEIDQMARDGAAWLERKGLTCRTVTIKVRYDDFTTITRSHSAPVPTRDGDTIAERAVALLEKTSAGVRPIRLLGVSVHNLANPDDPAEYPPLPLFDDA